MNTRKLFINTNKLIYEYICARKDLFVIVNVLGLLILKTFLVFI